MDLHTTANASRLTEVAGWPTEVPAGRTPVVGAGMRIGRLGAEDCAAVFAHLQRLSAEDRRMRFLQAMSDERLRAHVEALDFTDDAYFGCAVAGRLVALAAALPCGVRAVEAAFTTDAEWRGQGLAKALFAHIADWATGGHMAQVLLFCDRRNAPMRSLLTSWGATVDIDRDDVHATWMPQGGRA